MAVRLGPDEFIQTLKDAFGKFAWQLGRNQLTGDLELSISRDPEGTNIQKYLGPRLIDMTDLAMRRFLAELNELTPAPPVGRSHLL
jgi:hypothetical protein